MTLDTSRNCGEESTRMNHIERLPFACLFKISDWCTQYGDRWAKMDCQLGLRFLMEDLYVYLIWLIDPSTSYFGLLFSTLQFVLCSSSVHNTVSTLSRPSWVWELPLMARTNTRTNVMRDLMIRIMSGSGESPTRSSRRERTTIKPSWLWVWEW